MGAEVRAAGVSSVSAVVGDVGDAVAMVGPFFVDGEGKAPGDARVVEPDFCTSETSLAAISFFWRATCKSSCKKSSPEDCRLRGGFGSFCPEDVETSGTEAEVCTGVLSWGVGTLSDWETCVTWPVVMIDGGIDWRLRPRDVLADAGDGVTDALSGIFWDG